ncbi:MAG: glucosaminidase domain-containing protein [Aquabacterium sp.]
MLRSEFNAFARQAEAWDAGFAGLQAQAGSGQAASFGGLMREVQGEVRSFIEEGGAGDAAGSLMPAATLNPAAQARLLALMNPSGAPAASGLMPPALAAPHTAAIGGLPAAQQQFIDRIAPWAEDAGQALGVAPHLIAAHAALESGWGAKPLRDGQGRDAHNLFGVKATGAWDGEAVNAPTTEYEDGLPQARVERFRRYGSDAQAFADYTRLLSGTPRFQAVRDVGGDAQAFAQALARGGYATDPRYADKLIDVAARLHGAFAGRASAASVQSAAGRAGD